MLFTPHTLDNSSGFWYGRVINGSGDRRQPEQDADLEILATATAVAENRRKVVFRSAAFLMGCLLVHGIPTGIPVQADSSPQLFTIMLLVQDKKYPEAIAGYESFLK